MIDEHGAVVDHRLVGAARAVEVSLAHGDLGDVVERVEPLPTRIDPDVDEVLPGREGQRSSLQRISPSSGSSENESPVCAVSRSSSGVWSLRVKTVRLTRVPRSDSCVCFSKPSTMSKSLAGGGTVEQLAVPLEVEIDDAQLAVAVAATVPDPALQIRGDVPDVGVDDLTDLPVTPSPGHRRAGSPGRRG